MKVFATLVGGAAGVFGVVALKGALVMWTSALIAEEFGVLAPIGFWKATLLGLLLGALGYGTSAATSIRKDK